MKKIWRFLKHHIQEDFSVKYYTAIALFLAVIISLNYTLDFEDNYLERLTGLTRYLAYFAMYALVYYSAVALYILFSPEINVFRRQMFWIKSMIGITLLSIDSSMPFLRPLIYEWIHPQAQLWAFKVSINMLSFFTVFIPILLFCVMAEKEDRSLYGLRAKHFDTRPYFTMLLIMLPLIIVASFNDSFLRQYPMYRSSDAHLLLGVPEWVTVAGYEIAYGLDFVTVEYLFRGFLVIAMIPLLGRGAVLTMAVLYCSLHFGKPMGEAISSIAGGYILGVVAFETRSIWGGIIVHMGIAWMMELIAFLQKSL